MNRHLTISKLVTAWKLASTWILALSLLPCCGCSLNTFATQPVGPLAPVAFTGPPTLPQVMQVVNSNTQRVRQLHSDTVSVSTPGFPSLRSTLSVEKPLRFRLRGKLFGPELDLGSNDEVFWFWLKSSGQPGVMFARHDHFAQSAVQQMIPIEPAWVIESLGLVTLDPATRHEGPFPRGNGQVEVRSQIRGSRGEVTRTLVIDATYGWIVEQHVTDANQRLLVSALASRHRFYPEQGVSLPHQVEIRAAAANRTIQIDIGQYAINRPVENPYETWSLPNIAGQTPINLSNVPEGQVGGGTAVPNYGPGPATYPVDPRTGFRPEYRGYSQR